MLDGGISCKLGVSLPPGGISGKNASLTSWHWALENSNRSQMFRSSNRRRCPVSVTKSVYVCVVPMLCVTYIARCNELWLHLKFAVTKSLISQVVSIIKKVVLRIAQRGQTCRSCLAGGASAMGRESRLPAAGLPFKCAGAAAGAAGGPCVGAASLTSIRRNSDKHGHGTILKNKYLFASTPF